MNKTTSVLLGAAVTGLLLGSSCGGDAEPTAPAKTDQSTGGAKTSGANPAALAIEEKHACKGMSTCAGKGGCKTDANECAGKNSCQGKGGCATVAHHGCAGKNACKGQGGCGSGDNGCKGKNSCKEKGGCAVPIKH